MQALDTCINCRSQPGMQVAALQAVGGQIRAAVTDRAQGRLEWATDCFAAVVPSAVAGARELLQSASGASANAPSEQVRLESSKSHQTIAGHTWLLYMLLSGLQKCVQHLSQYGVILPICQ